MKIKLPDAKLDVLFVLTVLLQSGRQTDENLRHWLKAQKAMRPVFDELTGRLRLFREALRFGRASGYLCGGEARGWELTEPGRTWHNAMLQRLDPFYSGYHLRPEWRARFWDVRCLRPLPVAA